VKIFATELRGRVDSIPVRIGGFTVQILALGEAIRIEVFFVFFGPRQIPGYYLRLGRDRFLLTLTNQNSIAEEIKSRLRTGNAFYRSVQNLLSSRLLSKNLKIKI